MNYRAPLNPKAVSRTRQKRRQRARMAERWRASSLVLDAQIGRVLLGVDEAWKRWQADEALAQRQPDC